LVIDLVIMLEQFFKAFINSGFKVKECDVVIWSEVPIGAGLSSNA